jgi:large conductance mechanosensitive channel
MAVIKDFKNFILRGNVVDLAVAVVIGAAFGTIVTALTKDFITPLIAAAGGKPDFSSMYFTVHNSKFRYGDFFNALISFLIIALVVFFFVVQPVNKMIAFSKRHEETPPEDKTCPECLSSIPKAATRCAFCTVKLTPAKSPTVSS